MTFVIVGCGGADARKARHLAKGREFLAADNFEKARVEFRNALQIAPTDADARFENGVVDEKLGNPREAAQFYQGTIDVNPKAAEPRAALGRLYLFSGAPDKAMEAIKPALVDHPKDPDLLTVRAAARVQLKDTDGALQDAQEAVALAPTNENAVAVLAGVYRARNETEKARQLLEGAIKLIPGTVDLRLALAQVYSNLNLEPQVEAVLVDLVKLKPDEKAHRLRLAQFYARLNHDDDAERVLRDSISRLPKDRDLKLALVDFLAVRRSRDAAQKELTTLIAANPKDYDLRLAEAQFYEQGKDLPQAEAVYQHLIDEANSAPSAITARDRLAALKIQQGNIDAAEKLLADVLAKSPRDNDALILRGNLELAKQDPKAAIADFRAVLRDQPNAVGVMRTLARAHLANGEPALAEETMRKAVEANPKDVSSRLDLAQLLSQTGKSGQAKAVLDELLKQSPDNFAALELDARVCGMIQDFVCAKSAADAMVAVQPKAAIGYYYQGSVAEFSKHTDDAIRLYTAATDVQPDATEPLQALAVLLFKLNRTPEALKRLDDASARVPRMPTALNIKGELLMSTQHLADAELAFKGAIERDPTWWTPYRNLARAERLDHDAPAAVATLESGIAVAKEPEFLQIDLAQTYETDGKPDQAIKLYEGTLSKNPKADLAANNLAMILITYRKDQASLDRAKALSQRFSESQNPSFLDTYGWVLYKRGESAAALPVLQSALAKTPESPVSLYHVGMALASVGQDNEARDDLSRSLKAGKTFTGMDEAKATLDKLAKLPSTNSAPTS